MSHKRFRTRRQWDNTILWGLVSTGSVLLAVTLSGMTGNLVYLQVSIVIAAVGMVIAVAYDRPSGISYTIENDKLLLKAKGEIERIPLELIKDASLLDRRAARDMLNERLRTLSAGGAGKTTLHEVRTIFSKWCTVDIGLRSLTFGIGRDLIDKRPDAKHDIVLLRLADSRLIVLSPVYNQDMVESLTRTSKFNEQDRRRA